MVIAVLCMPMSGCRSNGQKAGGSHDNIRTIPILELRPVKANLFRNYVADIQAIRNVEIYARVNGYLEKVYIDEGKKVKKGQLLFRINSEEYEVHLAKAKANLESAIADAKGADLEVKRVKLLVEKNIVSKTELEVANAKLAAASAKIEEAKSEKSNAAIQLARTEIKAPFDGVVDRIPHRMGSLISSGTLLTTLSDTQSVFAYFNVSENEYLEYERARQKSNGGKATVELELADGTFFNHRGTIETMEGAFDESTGSIAFRAKFANPEGLLKHGSTGTIRLTNSVNDAILIPQQAAFEIQDKNFVYVLGNDNKVTTRSFIPRSRLSTFYVINSGLKSGEKIVCEGIQGLKDGTVIKPKIVRLNFPDQPTAGQKLSANQH